jgi:hypothetical protein
MRVNIQPVSIWKDGTANACQVVDINIQNSDWNTGAVLSYGIRKTANSEDLANGTVKMNNAEFNQWEAANFSKAFIKNFVCTKLSLLQV